MTRSLYAKLIAVLFGLVCAISVIYVALSVMTTRLYLQEVNQKLNHALAANIVSETALLRDGAVNQAALEELFHTLMVINPSIELYLVDPEGVILAFNAPPGNVKRARVSLEPVASFLGESAEFPILGDDPRHPSRTKVFSAAPVHDRAGVAGYLYIVLGGEAYDSAAQMILDSYILRVAAAIAGLSFVLSLVAGVISAGWLTRRLRRLSMAVDLFRQSDLRTPLSLGSWRRGARGDEIDRLGEAAEHMSRRIVDQIRQLRHADASRREMIANISHDLRTPLTSLQGYLETLLMKESELSDDERHHYLDLAAKHGARLGQLTAELFELAMLESQGADLHFEPFSLAELVQDVAQKFELKAGQKHIRLDTDIPRSAPFVSGDIALIERALANLIENAIKYTPDGGAIRLSLIPGRERIAARVSDSGIGIPAEDIPHIFERFYRVEKARGDGPEGTGLGLAIAQRILSLHGSPIDVESQPGAGTTFTFALPVAA